MTWVQNGKRRKVKMKKGAKKLYVMLFIVQIAIRIYKQQHEKISKIETEMKQGIDLFKSRVEKGLINP